MSAPTFKVQATRTFWLLDDVVEAGAVITVTMEMKKHLASLGAAFEVTDEAPAPAPEPAPAPAAPVAPTEPASAPVAKTEPVKAPAKVSKPAKTK